MLGEDPESPKERLEAERLRELLETWKKGPDIPIPVNTGRSEADHLRGEIKKLVDIKNQLEKYFESFMDFNEKLLEAMKKGSADWDGVQ